jgi:hypothetical protein
MEEPSHNAHMYLVRTGLVGEGTTAFTESQTSELLGLCAVKAFHSWHVMKLTDSTSVGRAQSLLASVFLLVKSADS